MTLTRSSFAAAALLVACAPRTSFRATDSSFRAGPIASRPPVYLDNRLVSQWGTSVGLITVILRTGVDVEAAVDAAADMGQRVGCSLLVEHEVYRGAMRPVALEDRPGRSAAQLHDDGAHPSGSIPRARNTSSSVMQFDCVSKAAPGRGASR